MTTADLLVFLNTRITAARLLIMKDAENAMYLRGMLQALCEIREWVIKNAD